MTHRIHMLRPIMFVLMIFVILGAAGGVAYVIIKYTSARYQTNIEQGPLQVTPDMMVNVTFKEFNAIFSPDSEYTDIAKKEIFKEKYNGRYVRWTGYVSDIEDKFWKGGLIIKVKHQDDDWQEDTMVWMREEEKPKAMMLKKGEQITYVAKMNGLSTILFPYRLSDGTLVK